MDNMSKLIKRNKLAPWQEMDEQALVLTPKKSTVHELNETATWIWKRLNGDRTLESIQIEMCEVFDIEPNQARNDLYQLINDMSEKGMILDC